MKTLLLTGYGINCEEEMQHGFELAGSDCDILHINTLIDNPALLSKYQILGFPGGFSYGDHTGSGNVLASKFRSKLLDVLYEFRERDTLIFGVCNGFQILVSLGLLPGGESELTQSAALIRNESSVLECRWVNLISTSDKSVFMSGIDKMRLPVSHGEGKFFVSDSGLERLKSQNQIICQYADASFELADGQFPDNPNGAVNDIAGICDETGRVFGMMPHPDRCLYFTNQDDWTSKRYDYKDSEVPVYGPGLTLFKNAVSYFK